MKDYYAILGLPYTASAAEIDAAFRSLAKKHHPDLHPQDKQSLELFKLATEAHEVLSNAAKRRDYDLARQRRRASHSQHILCPRSSEHASHRRPPTQSLDLEARLSLVPEEARCGGAIDLKLTYPTACPRCVRTTEPGCPVCGGNGTHLESHSLTLRLPPGLVNGEVLRVPGLGRSAGVSGPRGDLRLVIEVRPCW